MLAPRGAFRLLISAPKKDNWSHFVESPAVREFVLPVFTENEMLELRSVAFGEAPGCSEADMRQRFLRPSALSAWPP